MMSSISIPKTYVKNRLLFLSPEILYLLSFFFYSPSPDFMDLHLTTILLLLLFLDFTPSSKPWFVSISDLQGSLLILPDYPEFLRQSSSDHPETRLPVAFLLKNNHLSNGYDDVRYYTFCLLHGSLNLLDRFL